MAAEWYPTNRIRWKDGVLQQLHLQRNRTWDSVAALWYVQEETEWRDVPTENTQPTQETSPAPEPAPAGCEDWWHLRPYGYAPGKYTMKCPHCQVSVWDVDKRASCCKPCAIAFYESAQSEVNR
jgi:hypothetical protein